ncbi:hypothetical protein LJR225_005159 [Phenylobacterium sp. LjRoot225]
MIEAFSNPLVQMALFFGLSLGGAGLVTLLISNRNIAREERRLSGH